MPCSKREPFIANDSNNNRISTTHELNLHKIISGLTFRENSDLILHGSFYLVELKLGYPLRKLRIQNKIKIREKIFLESSVAKLFS